MSPEELCCCNLESVIVKAFPDSKLFHKSLRNGRYKIFGVIFLLSCPSLNDSHCQEQNVFRKNQNSWNIWHFMAISLYSGWVKAAKNSISPRISKVLQGQLGPFDLPQATHVTHHTLSFLDRGTAGGEGGKSQRK